MNRHRAADIAVARGVDPRDVTEWLLMFAWDRLDDDKRQEVLDDVVLLGEYVRSILDSNPKPSGLEAEHG